MPSGREGRTETPASTPAASTPPKSEGGIPGETQKAERIARQIVEGVESGLVRPQDLEGLGLGVERLKSFLQEVERARALMASVRGRPDAPPTFADLLRAMDPNRKSGEGAGAVTAGSKGEPGQDPRHLVEGLKETVDLEYQQLLEEYYRSLADPAWKRSKK